MEHRLSPRKSLNVPVTLHFPEGSVHCLSYDVNADGMFVRGPIPCIRVNTPVKLTIGDSSNTVFATYKAMAVRIGGDGIGLMFDKTESTIYDMLQAMSRVRRCYTGLVSSHPERAVPEDASAAA